MPPPTTKKAPQDESHRPRALIHVLQSHIRYQHAPSRPRAVSRQPIAFSGCPSRIQRHGRPWTRQRSSPPAMFSII